jgi:hypothetical protein
MELISQVNKTSRFNSHSLMFTAAILKSKIKGRIEEGVGHKR